MMTTRLVSNYQAVHKHYNARTQPVKDYFEELPKLIEHTPWAVCLAYAFLKLEQAHNMILYCGVVKLHQVNKDLAKKVIGQQHLTRDGFKKLYENVFGKEIPQTALALLNSAEKTRDQVFHGKSVKDDAMRKALVDVLSYAEQMNAQLSTIAGFTPFGDLRGFKGAGKSLGTNTSRWLLKGLGFTLQ